MLELSEVLNKKVAVISFGRINPPTNGHEKLINKLLSTAKSNRGNPFLFLSHTQDSKKNPLSSKQKEKYIKLGIPGISKHIVNDSNIRTIFDALNYLIKLGYNNVILVVGSDRVKEFDSLVKKYIKHPDPSKSVNLDSFSVISAGDRDPDSEGISGISASKMREFVKQNNFNAFKDGVPSKLSDKYSKEMFNDLKKSMRIMEMVELGEKLNISMNEPSQIKKNVCNKYYNMENYINNNGNDMKTLKEILEEVDTPTETDKVKDRQEREKEQLSIKHARQLERAKEQDFENKQTEVRQKEKEKLIQKNINK